MTKLSPLAPLNILEWLGKRIFQMTAHLAAIYSTSLLRH